MTVGSLPAGGSEPAEPTRDRLLPRIARDHGATAALIAFGTPGLDDAVVIDAHGVPPAFRRRYRLPQPVRPLEADDGAAMAAWREDRDPPDSGVGASAFDRDWLAPQGLRFLLRAELHRHGLRRLEIMLARSGDRPGFSADDLQRLRSRRATIREQLLTETLTERGGLAGLLEILPCGILILDPAGHLILMNREAERALAGHPGLGAEIQARARRRPAPSAKDPRAGRGGEAPACPGNPFVREGLPGDEPVLMPLGGAGAAAGFTAVVLRRDEHEAPGPASLQTTYGLTRAEAQLAMALTGGLALKVAAYRQGITEHTARTYLKRIFEKTGVHRQSALVRLVLSS